MIRIRPTVRLLPPIAAMLLAGCWAAPVATVQPKGPPRLIQKGVVVESGRPRAIVQSVDRGARIIVLGIVGDTSTYTYRVGPKVAGFDHLIAGEKVYAVVKEELTICVSGDGRFPGTPPGVPQPFVSSAKVLSVDTSYRLLTLQYPTGQSETLKVGGEVELAQMEAGDDVTIQPLEVVAVSAHKPWWR